MEDLRQRLAAQGVRTLLAQFTDLHGVAKGKLVPLAHLETLLRDGAGFSGPSIAGTGLPRTASRLRHSFMYSSQIPVPAPASIRTTSAMTDAAIRLREGSGSQIPARSVTG